MKTYATDPNFTFTSPRERDLLGDEKHHAQAQMYVVAKTKKAAVEFLIAVGEPSHIAESLMRRARVIDDSRPADLRAAVAAGVVDPDSPGAYLFSMNRGSGVVSLTVDGPVRVATDLTRFGSGADRFRLDTSVGSHPASGPLEHPNPGEQRPVERIDVVLDAVRDFWLRNPDMRLGQILHNAAGQAPVAYVEDAYVVDRLAALTHTQEGSR